MANRTGLPHSLGADIGLPQNFSALSEKTTCLLLGELRYPG